MDNEKDLDSIDFNSPEFQANIRKTIEEATWGKGGPMSYIDDDGWIVRHWEDGRIEKIKDTKIPSTDRFYDIIKKYSQQRNKIDFQEEPTSGYRMRTIKNAAADATIAFATDFTTSGEKLTFKATVDQGKMYIPINVNTLTEEKKKQAITRAINDLNMCGARTLNIAGNGIYTMKGRYTQSQVDELTYEILHDIITSEHLVSKIESIRSGGQTGFDEAGAKAGVRLGLPTIILAPKGWGFRDMSGVDQYDEIKFKQRFDTI